MLGQESWLISFGRGCRRPELLRRIIRDEKDGVFMVNLSGKLKVVISWRMS